MPKGKARKHKVKSVVVPKGDEGKDLTKSERAAKLESFIDQFNMEVQARLDELDEEYAGTCKAIDNAGKSILLSMTPEQASMPIMEYRRSLLASSSKRESGVQGANISAVLKHVDNLGTTQSCVKPSRKVKGEKVAGFATPLAGARMNETLWTDTPIHTPMFDKRLLGVVTKKPSGLSLNGQNIETMDVKKMSKSNKAELSKLLNSALQKLK